MSHHVVVPVEPRLLEWAVRAFIGLARFQKLLQLLLILLLFLLEKFLVPFGLALKADWFWGLNVRFCGLLTFLLACAVLLIRVLGSLTLRLLAVPRTFW